MDITEQYRRNVRIFYGWIGSIAILGISPIVAIRMIHHDTTLWRAAGALIGAVGALPWMWVVYRIVKQGDEFVRRMHLVAVAIASAACLIMLMTIDWLQRAEFIETPDMMFIWPACLVIWLIALVATKRHFERPE